MSKRRQYSAAVCATLMTATSGMFVGWPSPSLPRLIEQGVIGASDGSWIASVYMLSSSASVLPAAYMADRFGRKFTIICGCLPFVLGWILLIFAESALVLYISRIVAGLGHGIVYTACPMYLGEIAEDRIRGALASTITLMSKAGILFEYCIGPYVSIKTMACINLCVPCLFVLTFPFQPESPYYYLKKGDVQSAEKSLKTLNGCEDVNGVLSKSEAFVREQMKEERRWADLVLLEHNRRSLIILFVLYTVQQFCGSSAVITYAQTIFDEASGSMGSSESSMITGGVQLVVAFVSVFLVDVVGRKPLLIISTLGVTLTDGVLCAYFYLAPPHLGWLPVVTLSAFIVSYTIGLATVPFAITSEVFPVNLKSYATCCVQMYAGVASFAVVKLYQVVGDAYGQHVIFMCFAVVSLLGVVYVLVCVPETKGRSFEDIQCTMRRSPKL